MNLKLKNEGQFELKRVPLWIRRNRANEMLWAVASAKVGNSLSKSQPQFNCVFEGKTFTAASETELRRRVEAAVHDKVQKEFTRILKGRRLF